MKDSEESPFCVEKWIRGAGVYEIKFFCAAESVEPLVLKIK